MLLVGNNIPMGLIRRAVIIFPITLEKVRDCLQEGPWLSFWGDQGTLKAARELLGVDLSPAVKTPVVKLSKENFPMLDGEIARKVLVISPTYIGEAVPSEAIAAWQYLLIQWIGEG